MSDGFLHPPFCFCFFFFVAFFFVAAVVFLLTGAEAALVAAEADAGTDATGCADAKVEAEVGGGPAQAREGLAIMGLQLDATGCRWK